VKRYFYQGTLEVGNNLTLQGDLFHHIFEVCRLQKGQHFELINVDGKAYLTCVESIEKKMARVNIKEQRQIPRLREPHIKLFLSFPKVPTFEMIVEKSVELGVKSITPILSDFSQVRSRSQFPTPKMARWEKIILQATQQSGRGDLMKIEEPIEMKNILPDLLLLKDSLNVVAYEGESNLALKEFLTSKRTQQSSFKRINLFVGSEGGFSDSEIQKFRELDLTPVTLGEQVLRVETACLTLVASLKYEFDLLR
jgi:16S rRNA (uracil1498-N3)-methyltransferase